MKRWLCILALYGIMFMVGCKTLEQVNDGYKACMEDPECVQLVRNVDSGVKSGLPSEYGWMIGLLVSNVVAVIAGSRLKIQKR